WPLPRLPTVGPAVIDQTELRPATLTVATEEKPSASTAEAVLACAPLRIETLAVLRTPRPRVTGPELSQFVLGSVTVSEPVVSVFCAIASDTLLRLAPFETVIEPEPEAPMTSPAGPPAAVVRLEPRPVMVTAPTPPTRLP